MTTGKAAIYHNLAVMLKAGVPLHRAFKTAASGLRGSSARSFNSLQKDIAAGSSIAEAMCKRKRRFSALDMTVIEAAENSGNLAESCDMLSKWYEFCARVHKIVISGMYFPILVLHIAVFVDVVPKMLLGGLSTQGAVITIMRNLAIFYVPVLAIIGIIQLTPDTGPLRFLVDVVSLKIPVLGKALRFLTLSRYCRVFHILAKAAIPIRRTAEISANMAGNAIIRRQLWPSVKSIQTGNLISEGFSPSLGVEFLSHWQIAEESGTIVETTNKLGADYGEKAEFLFTQVAIWAPRLFYFAVCMFIIKCIIENASLLGYR
ncbi:MAG: type II secretion system F family protein [Planctomycetota bacterium]